MPKLSIIIPVFNAEHFIRETLASITSQELGDVEVICVDDCSTDSSRALTRNIPGVSLLERNSNSGGCSIPRNDGIEVAQGEYIAIFDADDLMEPGKLAAQVKLLDSHPGVDFVFTDFVNFGDFGVGSRHTLSCQQFRSLLTNEVAEHVYIIDSHAAYRTLINENFVGASSMMFRKKLTALIGSFDPKLQSSEDIDFVFRAASVGSLGYVDMIGHRRRLHATNMTQNMKKVQRCYLSVLQRQLMTSHDSAMRLCLRQRISEVYWGLGYELCEEGQLWESAAMQIQSVKANWTNIRAYMGLVKGLLSYVSGKHKPQAIQS
ncbi:MAG: glycosyltransferase family 2 protein [Nitrospira sp.]